MSRFGFNHIKFILTINLQANDHDSREEERGRERALWIFLGVTIYKHNYTYVLFVFWIYAALGVYEAIDFIIIYTWHDIWDKSVCRETRWGVCDEWFMCCLLEEYLQLCRNFCFVLLTMIPIKTILGFDNKNMLCKPNCFMLYFNKFWGPPLVI